MLVKVGVSDKITI